MLTDTETPAGTGSFTTALHAADRGARLSLLWVFAVLNYLYCDVLGLFDTEGLKQLLTGHVGDIDVTQGFLLGSAILMEIPIAMVLLSSVLPPRGSRWANIVAGTVMTIVQIGSLFVGSSVTAFYGFFSVIEVACTAFIVWYAWRWHVPHSRARASAS